MSNYVQKAQDELKKVMGVGELEDSLMDLYTLLLLTLGDTVSDEDVHDAWSVWKNRTKPDHKSIVPFDELSEDDQKMAEPFTEYILKAADEIW